ncbi:MAG: ankyrin repeat domain-containing protein [Saprospiraceae bacterium]|nr:ankyrin repeat domain-containing protein [Saprospiraceae bacterium]
MAAGDWKEMLFAAQEGDLDLVKYHLEKGVNPNYQHPELLTTPLIESISFRQHEIVKYLLENGADPSLRAGFSLESPLAIAKQTKDKQLIKLVRSYLPKRSFLLRPFWDQLKAKIIKDE